MTLAGAAETSSLFLIRFERHLPYPDKDVWAAVSDEKQITAWLEYPAQLNPVTGGRVFIDFSPQEPIEGVVSDAKAGELLAYTWRDSLVKWEVAPQGKDARLIFSHFGVKPEFLTGLTAGWHCFLDNLEAHLAGRPFHDRFDELQRYYEAAIAG